MSDGGVTDGGMTDDGISQFVAMMPFAELLGIELDQASAERVTGRLRWREELCTAGGVMHGGALMALADTIGAVCAFLNLPPGAGTATISSSTNMLRAVRTDEVIATARPLRAGRSVIAVQTELHDSKGRLVAHVTQAQAVLAAGSPSA
jgi:1,4-dihydroxy-2-naphthoyl-CoA hydrolase